MSKRTNPALYVSLALVGWLYLAVGLSEKSWSAEWPVIEKVDRQPFLSQVFRLGEAMTANGFPWSAEAEEKIEAAKLLADDLECIRRVQEVLDELCFLAVEIGENGKLTLSNRGNEVSLSHQGWQSHLIKVVNPLSFQGRLRFDSLHAKPIPNATHEEITQRWLAISTFDSQPLSPSLSGLPLEYRIVDLYSRDLGTKEGEIEVALADQDSRTSITCQFVARPSGTLVFKITDDPDRPPFACFEITDLQGRVYPPQNKRVAPDFFFQRQIYRGDGESISLPAGTYQVVCSRGPESISEVQSIVIEADSPTVLEYKVRKWIDPSRMGYWSGDHHIHAAGCAHYERPTEGVGPEDMLRHCMGEDLKVGCCLTWGPGFDYQKQFFTGKLDRRSRYPYMLRYDIEVSGYGSHVSGHLNLLRLTHQIPPGGNSKDHWPTLGLNTLRWAKSQNAVVGPAHSANGLTRYVGRIPDTEGLDGPNGLPTFQIPAYDGIGANEFIMNVPHRVPNAEGQLVPAVDFISTMNTDRSAELNMWYHVLNCGYRVRCSGETDFPCITGERVGMGRVYVKLDEELDFDEWCTSLANGRSYVSDGRTHLMEFEASVVGKDDVQKVGEGESEIELGSGETIIARVQAAARYEGTPTIPVELIVNGYPVGSQELVADGQIHELRFETKLEQSSWIAVRVFPTGHTNPIFAIVDGKPIRANRKSVEWCLAGVDECWKSKARTYHPQEFSQAEADYEYARQAYQQLLQDFDTESSQP